MYIRMRNSEPSVEPMMEALKVVVGAWPGVIIMVPDVSWKECSIA